MRQRTKRRHEERATKKTGASTGAKHSQLRDLFLFGSVLVVWTLCVYSSALRHDFINFDDDDYILRNPHVTAGLNWQTIRWSFTSTEQSNWHPITWLSHSLDCQLFGLDAGYHHLTSMILHALNALLLFLLLHRVTKSLGRSFLVATLFAWHPLAVESVAWAAERKNVLSTFFFLLALAAYGWHALHPRIKSLAIVATLYALSLASKPMAVTFPFILILLDYWPLQRIEGWTAPSPSFPLPQENFRRLLLEKLPFLVLSAASSAITIWAQRAGGAMRSFQSFPLDARFGNAAYSYLLYLWKMFWPLGLAVFYPHPGTGLPSWKPILAVGILSAVTAVGRFMRKTRPYLLIGWLWFLGTMIPVIGIVQVGDQALADRYTYLPLIGLFVMLVWGISDILALWNLRPALRWSAASIVFAVLSFLTVRQLLYWQNGVTIWSHAFEVTKGNLKVEKQLANAMIRQGETDVVGPHLIHIAELDPSDISNRVNLGNYYSSQGREEDAIHEFEQAVNLTGSRELSPQDKQSRSSALINLGLAYTTQRNYRDALASFGKANESDTATVDQMIERFSNSFFANPSEIGCIRLALLLQARGKSADAFSLLEKAITANPDATESREVLAYLK